VAIPVSDSQSLLKHFSANRSLRFFEARPTDIVPRCAQERVLPLPSIGL
jgi:hypothetical protein